MQALNQWLQRQRTAQQRLVTIQQALIGNAIPAYLRYRLRFFTFSTLIITAVHLIEFYLLTVIFSFTHIVSILMLRSIGMALSGYWWGNLELLRSQVRQAHRAKNRERIDGIIASWLILATVLALITVATFTGVISYRYNNHISPAEVLFLIYVAVIGISIAAQFFTQTLHAGAYGLRRVYRPFWSIPLANIIGLLVLAAGWPLLHQYSLPLAMLISSILALLLTLIYTLKTYHVLGLQHFLTPNIKAFKSLLQCYGHKEIWLASISSLLMRTEGLLVLIMLIGVHHTTEQYESFILFYLIAPLISASFDWPRLFYFDLKRFNRQSFKPMLDRLNYHVLRVSLWVGFGLWLITLLIAVMYFQQFYTICFILLPFFLARAYSGYQQMLQFCANRYYDVIICAGSVLIMAIVARGFELSIDGAIASLVAIIAAGILYLRQPHTICVQNLDEDPLPNVYQWIKEWNQHTTPPQAQVITIDDSNINRLANKITLRINKALHGVGKACMINDTHVLFFQTKPIITQEWLVSKLAGLVLSVNQLNESLASFLYHQGQLSEHVHSGYLVDQFKREVKDGIIVTFDSKQQSTEQLNRQQSSDIYFSMLHTLNSPLTLQLEKRLHTLVLYNNGVQVLLVIPKYSLPISQIKHWVKQVYVANLHQLLSPVRSED